MPDEKKENGPLTAKLQFNYIKGPGYREVACHGAIGGTTPQGKIWMSLFAERPPIPRIVEFDLPKPASPNEPVLFEEQKATPGRVESRQGVIRHIECTVYMDLDTAKRIHEWLGNNIQITEARGGGEK
jgi:hypothetical protein